MDKRLLLLSPNNRNPNPNELGYATTHFFCVGLNYSRKSNQK